MTDADWQQVAACLGPKLAELRRLGYEVVTREEATTLGRLQALWGLASGAVARAAVLLGAADPPWVGDVATRTVACPVCDWRQQVAVVRDGSAAAEAAAQWWGEWAWRDHMATVHRVRWHPPGLRPGTGSSTSGGR